MKRLLPSFARLPRVLFGAAIGLACLVRAGESAAQGTPPRLAAAQGFIIDSIHNTPLGGAFVRVEGTDRVTRTTPEGRYQLDSIPPGSHRVILSHPLLDTIGMAMSTKPVTFSAGETTSLDLAIPSGERIVSMFCPAMVLRVRGPGALIGFVKDPETGGPATGAKVQLVYEQTDPLGFKKTSVTREAAVDSTGSYKICGIPTPMTGKVQVFKNGVSSGEVAAGIEQGALGLRSLSIAGSHVVATVTADSGPAKRVFRGTARLSGKVVNKQGQPLSGARVTVQGSGITAVSRTNGEFVLDSLPPGTQSLDVRKLGYGATEQAVELASGAPSSVNVIMSDYVPTLATIRVEAEKDKALADIGYTGRKQTGLGYFLDGDNLNTQSLKFSDAMRTLPGVKVMPLGDGRTSVITSSRDPQGCVNFVVDGTKWTEMTPGDIDDYVRPDELRAVEFYNPSTVPAQFATSGQTKCATMVVWTVRSVNRSKKR